MYMYLNDHTDVSVGSQLVFYLQRLRECTVPTEEPEIPDDNVTNSTDCDNTTAAKV